jgi:hypothetical protein
MIVDAEVRTDYVESKPDEWAAVHSWYAVDGPACSHVQQALAFATANLEDREGNSGRVSPTAGVKCNARG